MNGGEACKVDGGELVVVDSEAPADAANVLEGDGLQVVAGQVDAAADFCDLAKVDSGEKVVAEVNVAWDHTGGLKSKGFQAHVREVCALVLPRWRGSRGGNRVVELLEEALQRVHGLEFGGNVHAIDEHAVLAAVDVQCTSTVNNNNRRIVVFLIARTHNTNTKRKQQRKQHNNKPHDRVCVCFWKNARNGPLSRFGNPAGEKKKTAHCTNTLTRSIFVRWSSLHLPCLSYMFIELQSAGNQQRSHETRKSTKTTSNNSSNSSNSKNSNNSNNNNTTNSNNNNSNNANHKPTGSHHCYSIRRGAVVSWLALRLGRGAGRG